MSFIEICPAKAAAVVLSSAKLENLILRYESTVPKPSFVGRSSKVSVMFLLLLEWTGFWDGRVVASTELRKGMRRSRQMGRETGTIFSVDVEYFLELAAHSAFT